MGSTNFATMTDPIAMPSGLGISGTAIDSSASLATNGLTFDTSGATGTLPTNPVLTIIESVAPTTSATQSGGAAGAVSSSKSISLATVVGSCVGAFIAVSILILLGIWFYRRYSESLKRQIHSRSALAHRNLQTDKQRRRSRLESWNKLEDGEDKWEGMQTKEVDQVVPMEKLTMFKRAASVRTAYTQKSVDDHPLTYPQSFAPFDTNLVRTLSADQTIIPHPQPSQATNSIKTQSPSNLSPLSPNLNMAIPTPEAIVHQSHKWESAEVVHYTEAQSADIVEPSVQDKDVRRSMHNPFFGSQEYTRPKSDASSNERSPNVKGKERVRDSMQGSMISSDPFEALMTSQTPKPPIVQHQATDSSASSQSKDRALQTLMGALELSEDEVRERLRVASMQPSVISQLSQFSTPLEEEEFLKTFVLPPRPGNSTKS